MSELNASERARAEMEADLVPTDDRAIGVAVRRSLFILVGGAAVAGSIWWIATRTPSGPPKTVRDPAAPVAPVASSGESPPSIPFTDITSAAGITFSYANGAMGDKLLPETMGGGVAFLDFDGDGHQDLFFVNGTAWPWDLDAASGRKAAPSRCALYRNDGKGTFVDVTETSGLGVSLHGMGVAVGDYDGDGLVDLFITAVGTDRLFRNRGGSFEEVTDVAGVGGGDSGWSTGAAFVDVDRDGDLDLFVVDYVKWSREIDFRIDFRLTGIGRAYGPPTNFEGTDSRLHLNNGDGTFTDASAEAGVRVRNPATNVPTGKGMAVIPVDFDGDGWIDLVVANDTVQKFAFRNLGATGKPGVFEEIGLPAGLAMDRNGAATGAMGIDAAAFRNDGVLAIAVGNFANEMTSFYVSRAAPPHRLPYSDDAVNEGIGAPSRLFLKFGLFFFDADLDGRLDLLQANGHIEEEISITQPSQSYEQRAQLFWNRGARRPGEATVPVVKACFVEMAEESIGGLATRMVGRGAACADIDCDGDLDVVITPPRGSPLLLRNDQALGHHWLRVRLLGAAPNTSAIGAMVELTAGGVAQRRMVMPTRSYLSQVELPVTFGLGKVDRVDAMRVTWPTGQVTDHAVEGIDREFRVSAPRKQTGPAVKPAP